MPKISKIKITPSQETAPLHLGVIMDGNRRWAKKRFLPKLEGHRRGYQKLKELAEWCVEEGIKILTVYAFSTENKRRSRREVSYLMRLFRFALGDELETYLRQGIRVKVIGQREELPRNIQRRIAEMEKRNVKDVKLDLQVAIYYGARSEIVHAIREIAKKVRDGEIADIDRISEDTVQSFLWVPDDVDLVIRTGGERRLSNFLLWQTWYTELYFTDTLWPDFTKDEFTNAIADFRERKRNYGK